MSAAPQKLTKMQVERQISIRKDKRATFNEGMSPLLRQSPLIILPALNLNIYEITRTSLYKSDNYIASLKRSPPIQKEPFKSEATVNATKNMEFTPNTEDDVSKNESAKARFFSELNLVRRTTPSRAFVVNDSELPPEWLEELRERRSQVMSFLKDDSSSSVSSTALQTKDPYPSPSVQITRCDGLYLPENQLKEYEDDIPQRNENILPPAFKLVRKHHARSSGTRQIANKKRDGPSEGNSLKDLSFLKCRDFSIEVQKMTDLEIAEAMHSVQNAQLKATKKTTLRTSRLLQQWVSSEPRAGPSRNLEILAEPVVRLDDFRA